DRGRVRVCRQQRPRSATSDVVEPLVAQQRLEHVLRLHDEERLMSSPGRTTQQVEVRGMAEVEKEAHPPKIRRARGRRDSDSGPGAALKTRVAAALLPQDPTHA